MSCTQPQNTAQTAAQRKYYHNRSLATGSNIPHSYTDSASANATGSNMSAANQMELDQAQRSLGTSSGGGAGGR